MRRISEQNMGLASGLLMYVAMRDTECLKAERSHWDRGRTRHQVLLDEAILRLCLTRLSHDPPNCRAVE